MTTPSDALLAARDLSRIALASATTLQDPVSRTLDDLARRAGTTRALVATACGVDPLLFERVDQGRQPMPLSVVVSIASLLRIPMWMARAACRSWTDQIDARLRNPKPPRPILGDSLPAVSIVATVPQP